MFTVMHFFPPSHIHMASFHRKLFFFFLNVLERLFLDWQRQIQQRL